MRSIFTRRPSAAMIVAFLALFVALSGGAYAATTLLPVGSVGRQQIKGGAVNTSKLTRWINSRLSVAGIQGTKGAKGATGATGAAGVTRTAGAQGATGATGSQGPAGQQGLIAGYEVDNGANWSLGGMPLALANGNTGYEDAGVTVDIGQASQFTGITDAGSNNLKDNVWISNGSQAYSFGENSLSNSANFTYGSDNGNGTYYMDTGSNAGQNLTSSQIASDYAGYEAYAWVGITSNGTDSVSGNVTSVNGTSVSGHLTLDGTTARASN